MTERLDPSPTEATVTAAPQTRLREARQARGLTLSQLSVHLKISERRLAAFEEGRWAEVGDRTFVRALAQSLCRHFGLDPGPILAALPASEHEPRQQPDRGPLPASAPPALRSLRKASALPGRSDAKLSPVKAGVAFILLAALVLAFAPSSWWGGDAAVPGGVTPPAPVPANEPVLPAPPAPPVIGAPGVEPPSMPATTVQTPPSGPAVPGSPVPAGSAPPTPTSAGTAAATSAGPAIAGATPNANSASPPTLAVAGGGLRIQARQPSWILVTDAQGTTLLSRTVQVGEQLELQGVPPIKVRVGNVAGTDLRWRGREVDLLGAQRNNVADLELP